MGILIGQFMQLSSMAVIVLHRNFSENHMAPPTYQETVPITNVLTARIRLWKNSRCF